MRLIDADALKQTFCAECARTQCENCSIDYHFNNAPTVDAEEVVRCKDCKYYEETDSRIGTCLLTISGAEVGGFCAWGEIKDETD